MSIPLADLTALHVAHGKTVEVSTPAGRTYCVRKARAQHPDRVYAAENSVQFYPAGVRYYPDMDALRADLATLDIPPNDAAVCW